MLGDNPSVSYHRLPLDSFPGPCRKTRKELYRGLCVTEGGQQRLRFVNVARDDGAGMGSVFNYIKGEEDLATDDADMVNTKPYFFVAFLPTEFPKFLNPKR